MGGSRCCSRISPSLMMRICWSPGDARTHRGAFIRCSSGRVLDECGQDSKGLSAKRPLLVHKKLIALAGTRLSATPIKMISFGMNRLADWPDRPAWPCPRSAPISLRSPLRPWQNRDSWPRLLVHAWGLTRSRRHWHRRLRVKFPVRLIDINLTPNIPNFRLARNSRGVTDGRPKASARIPREARIRQSIRHAAAVGPGTAI